MLVICFRERINGPDVPILHAVLGRFSARHGDNLTTTHRANRRSASRPLGVFEPRNPLFQKPVSPLADRVLADAECSGSRRDAWVEIKRQDDLSAKYPPVRYRCTLSALEENFSLIVGNLDSTGRRPRPTPTHTALFPNVRRSLRSKNCHSNPSSDLEEHRATSMSLVRPRRRSQVRNPRNLIMIPSRTCGMFN